MQAFRLLLAASVSFGCVLAQEPVYTLKVNVDRVPVDVAVFDAGNRPVASLTAQDFQVFEDGIPQKIVDFSPMAAPYHILLLFDRSGSTQSQWTLMQRAAAGFLSRLRGQDRVAIAAFDEEFEMLQRWTAGGSSYFDALDRLARPQSAGQTDFYGSLERSVTREFRGIAGRRVALVLTDGRDTALYKRTLALDRVPGPTEDREYQRVLRAAQKESIPLYFIALNTDRNLNEGSAVGGDYLNLRRLFPGASIPLDFVTAARTRMEELAGATGGRVFFPKGIEDVIPLYDQIARELSASYTLAYEPARRENGGGNYRRIEVRTREPGWRVWQSRTGYYVGQ